MPSSLLPSSFITIYLCSCTRRKQFSVESACVSLFLVLRRIDEYISLDLFCFVNLISSCSLIPKTKMAGNVWDPAAWGARTAQWLERQTRDRKFGGSSPRQERREKRLLQGHLSVLTHFGTRSPPRPPPPRVTAVARKRSLSFWGKVQVAGYK